MLTVLAVDDDREFLAQLGRGLSAEFHVDELSDLDGFPEALASHPDVVLLDVRLRGAEDDGASGLSLLSRVRSTYPGLPVVMMTAYGDMDVAVEALRRGADDFIQKDQVSLAAYRKAIENAISKRSLKRRVEVLEADLERKESWKLVGDHPRMSVVRDLINIAAADGRANVLVEGETGTGKELAARLIHTRSSRSRDPFVPVAISSLNPNMVESELFGHVKGAFTGAESNKTGYLSQADGGVLLLDEIADLDPGIQVKLLRFIEERTFQRVGSTEPITVDIQLVAASNRDLSEAVENEAFREDLYYRLNTLRIALPPLRERRSDIPALAHHFLDRFRSEGRTRANAILDDTLEVLERYTWPGNVRELRSVLERAVIFCEARGDRAIELSHLPLELRGEGEAAVGPLAGWSGGTRSVDEALARTELRHVQRALERSDWKKTDAWKLLEYTNRQAMTRRVHRAFEKFPDLVEEFSELAARYRTPGDHDD